MERDFLANCIALVLQCVNKAIRHTDTFTLPWRTQTGKTATVGLAGREYDIQLGDANAKHTAKCRKL